MGKTVDDVTGFKKVLVNPWVGTIITVLAGVLLGLHGYTLIWPLFGAANQLLAALAVVLAIKGARVIFGNKKKEIAE